MNKSLFLLVILIAAFLVFRIFISKQAVQHWQFIDFASLKAEKKPNYFLICPENYCQNTPTAKSPSFHWRVETLKQHWQQVIEKSPRTYLLGKDTKKQQWVYVQYSAFWHFPDLIFVEFIPLDEDKSTLAIYSHAIFGYSDFDVNKNRVKKWLNDLSKIT